MAEKPKSAQKKTSSVDDDGLIEGVEVELPPLFSQEMLSDTRFLLIVACLVVSGVFGVAVWMIGFKQWALSVFLFTFNVLLISWFYFLVQHVRKQIDENAEDEGEMTIHKSRKGAMMDTGADAAKKPGDSDASES